jgi:NTP pyrophosphatase (non-canonical NTP hydrolase)
MDHLGLTWQHPEFGTFKLTTENIPWIEKNALSSQYSKDRCYIYNKAFYEAFQDEGPFKTTSETPNRDIFPLIRDWARERGIFDKGNSHTQYVKLMEESGELAQSLLKKDKEGIKDAIGDMIVVLTNLSELEGMYIEDCIQFAYNEIKDRKGKMSNGTFVKKL